MNKEEIQKHIAEYFEKLPKEAQDVFSSMLWVGELEKISNFFNLSEEDTEILGTETMLLLLGIIHVDEFQKNIKNEIQKEPDVKEKIIEEVSKKILLNIKEQLIQTFTENENFLIKKNQNINETLDPRFQDLPENVKEAISLSEWRENLYSISSQHKLNIEQMGILEDLVVKTMRNEISAENFENTVSSKLFVDKEKVQAIVKEVGEKIFSEIRKIMMEESKEEVSSLEEEEVPIPPYANKAVEQLPPTPETKKEEEVKEEPSLETKEILKNTPLIIGNHLDFSAPKIDVPTPAQVQVKSVPVASAPRKPHDPYREII